jgi:hypothetical protein
MPAQLARVVRIGVDHDWRTRGPVAAQPWCLELRGLVDDNVRPHAVFAA